MAFPILAVPAFPSVPNVPGVPNIVRQVGAISTIPALITQDSTFVTSLFGGTKKAQWGIYDTSGNIVVTADTVYGLTFKKEWRIPIYPQEAGGFQSYNKVITPYSAKFTFIKTGSVASRAAFLDSIAQVCASLNLYNCYAPQVQYLNANATHYDYSQVGAKDTGMLTVDVWLEEINLNSAKAYSSTQAPSGAAPVNNGPTQPQTPAQNVLATIGDGPPT